MFIKLRLPCTTNTHESKIYTGVTASIFKSRINNRFTKSLNHPSYENDTKLSKHAWNLKRPNWHVNIKWLITLSVPVYSVGGRSCNQCLKETMSVLKSDRSKILNMPVPSIVYYKCQTEPRIQETRTIMITEKTIYIWANRKLITNDINDNQWHFPNLYGTLYISEVLEKYI